MPLSTPFRRFDVHCHFFNHDILSLRLLIELLVTLRRNKETLEVAQFSGNIRRYLHFVKIGFSSVEKIYQTLEKEEADFAFCPLMFDLEACVCSSKKNTTQEPLAEVTNELGNELREAVDNGDLGDDGEEIWSLFQRQMEHLDANKDHFLLQEQQLLGLKAAMPSRIFPFFGVDPRRQEFFSTGEGELSITPIIERLNTGNAFAGIKLYAPNGHSPADVRLLPLYAYCEKYQIPITAHCSGSGFATFVSQLDVKGPVFIDQKVQYGCSTLRFKNNKLTDPKRVEERAIALNHPALWEEVLKLFPHLKLNLAHFGLHDDGEWTRVIFAMMQKYPNLYTDFSCVTEKKDLEKFYNQYYSTASPDVKARFLYGSDFYLNILFISSMKEYMCQFTHCFSPEEWDALTISNPQRFLETKPFTNS